MARADPTGECDPVADTQWRLRYHVGDLVHYTEWTTEYATVENLADQYRRSDHGHDVVIERREANDG